MAGCICCKKCKKVKWSKGSIPEEGFFSKSKYKMCNHWTVVALSLCAASLMFIPEVRERVYHDGVNWHAPDPSDLKTRTVRYTSFELQSEALESNLQKLSWQMEHICEERTDDVVFAFQYSDNDEKRRRTDHMFMLCKTKKAYANAEVLFEDKTQQVYCKEEYAGAYREVKRSSSITVKGIYVDEWNSEQIETSDPQEACIIQHAIDVLDNKW